MRGHTRKPTPRISAAYVRLVDGRRVKARQIEGGGLYAPPAPRASKKSDIGDPGTIRIQRGGWLVDDGCQVYGVDAPTFEADYQAGTRVKKAPKADVVTESAPVEAPPAAP